jgi:hypothetical protein
MTHAWYLASTAEVPSSPDNDFLSKPVMEEELFEILGRHLKLKWIYVERN